MFRILLISALCGAALSADTIIGDLNSGAAGYTSGYHYAAQTFTVPADNVLTSWQFGVAGWLPFHGFTDTLNLFIKDWTGDLTTPSPSYLNASTPWPTTTGVVSFTGLDVPLVSGQSYVAIYLLGDYSGSAIGFYGANKYTGGQLLVGQDFAQLGASAASTGTSSRVPFNPSQ